MRPGAARATPPRNVAPTCPPGRAGATCVAAIAALHVVAACTRVPPPLFPPARQLELVAPVALLTSGLDAVPFSIRNGTSRDVTVYRPAATFLRLAVRRQGEAAPCRGPPPPRAAAIEDFVVLRPGARQTFTVDVTRRCGADLAGGDFHLEARYAVPAWLDGRTAGLRAWTGSLGPDVLSVAPTPGRASVPSAPPPAGAELPSSAELALPRFTPPAAADPQGGPATNLPPTGASAGRTLAPQFPPDVTAAVQACVDEELAREGLNAFGDRPGTPFPQGAPRNPDSAERYSWVLSHRPSIRSTCLDARPFR